MKKRMKAISLFSGAGGMDIGFKNEGIDVIWANEIDKDAYNTYKENNPETTIIHGDIKAHIEELNKFNDIDIMFGGPPCQGFSVAGKMDPNDERSTLIWTFLEAVNIVKPRAFVIENVKALAMLEKWEPIREKIIMIANKMGYVCRPFVLNSAEFGIPQKRERVFFIGFLDNSVNFDDVFSNINNNKKVVKTVREAIFYLGKAGTKDNPKTCTAKITFAQNPILRKSPYAGMLFNGIGRPLNLDSVASTLPASMGGNKTPIIDEEALYYNCDNWVIDYHNSLMNGEVTAKYSEAPSRLRRITIKEAIAIQTFPEDYKFSGSKSSIYRQIGNAVPCQLAQVVAKSVIYELNPKIYDGKDVFIDIRDSFIDMY